MSNKKVKLITSSDVNTLEEYVNDFISSKSTVHDIKLIFEPGREYSNGYYTAMVIYTE